MSEPVESPVPTSPEELGRALAFLAMSGAILRGDVGYDELESLPQRLEAAWPPPSPTQWWPMPAILANGELDDGASHWDDKAVAGVRAEGRRYGEPPWRSEGDALADPESFLPANPEEAARFRSVEIA